LNDHSPLRRLVTAFRDFGFIVTVRVLYSRVRGRIVPAWALPDAPVYSAGHREISILLSTAEHDAATLDAFIEMLAHPRGLGWELRICERAPAEPETVCVLAKFRGTQPWLRIVTADKSVDELMAARWTVEQATGQFIALVAPGYTPEAEAIAKLLSRLQNDSEVDAAVLVGADRCSGSPPSRVQRANCLLALQRKSGYLAAFDGRWPLTAPDLANDLAKAGIPIAYVSACEE
jgi:hypothetical protein